MDYNLKLNSSQLINKLDVVESMKMANYWNFTKIKIITIQSQNIPN
jgi:hypothetical protein